jgi:splicing factor 3B subunit 5
MSNLSNDPNLDFSEWLVNQHRDSNAAFVGHHSMLSYFAVAENESVARVKFNLIQVRLLPLIVTL